MIEFLQREVLQAIHLLLVYDMYIKVLELALKCHQVGSSLRIVFDERRAFQPLPQDLVAGSDAVRVKGRGEDVALHLFRSVGAQGYPGG